MAGLKSEMTMGECGTGPRAGRKPWQPWAAPKPAVQELTAGQKVHAKAVECRLFFAWYRAARQSARDPMLGACGREPGAFSGH